MTRSLKNNKNIFKYTYMMYEVINGSAITEISIYEKQTRLITLTKTSNNLYRYNVFLLERRFFSSLTFAVNGKYMLNG